MSSSTPSDPPSDPHTITSSTSSSCPPGTRIALVGSGRVAGSLARALAAVPHVTVFGLWGRDTRTAAARAHAAGVAVLTVDDLADADLVVLAVSDSAIATVAGECAARMRALGRAPRWVVHVSGASGLAPLAPFAELGSERGVWHPLQAFPTADTAPAPGVTWTITAPTGGPVPPTPRPGHVQSGPAAEAPTPVDGSRDERPGASTPGSEVGEPSPVTDTPDTSGASGRPLPGTAPRDDLASVLTTLTRALGGHPRLLAEENRTAYHAAAVLASNLPAALVARAVEVLVGCGFTRGDALDAVLPLLRSSVEALAAAGLPGGLTGPTVRGDVATVAAHLDALDEESRALYAAATRALLPSAARLGVDEDALASLEALLGPR